VTSKVPLTGDLQGQLVEITSRGGIVYQGIVREIRRSDDGEIFVLDRAEQHVGESLVYVTERADQIRLVSP
jgi:hypothetical protein